MTATTDNQGSLVGHLRKTSPTGITDAARVPRNGDEEQTPGRKALRAGITYALFSEKSRGRLCWKSAVDISASSTPLSSSAPTSGWRVKGRTLKLSQALW